MGPRRATSWGTLPPLQACPLSAVSLELPIPWPLPGALSPGWAADSLIHEGQGLHPLKLVCLPALRGRSREASSPGQVGQDRRSLGLSEQGQGAEASQCFWILDDMPALSVWETGPERERGEKGFSGPLWVGRRGQGQLSLSVEGSRGQPLRSWVSAGAQGGPRPLPPPARGHLGRSLTRANPAESRSALPPSAVWF